MPEAQRAADADQRVSLWAELSVLGHLTGWAMPAPARDFGQALRAMDARLRDCALAHAVDAAVAARAPAIVSRVSPGLLAAHITAAMRQGIADGSWLCEREEPQYLASPFRWVLVLDSLRLATRDPGRTGPHPRTAEWEHTYGQPIPGDSCARQLETVRRWQEHGQRDAAAVKAIIWGLNQPATIERATTGRLTDEDWDQRITGALAAFRDLRWPLDYLRRPHASPGKSRLPCPEAVHSHE